MSKVIIVSNRLPISVKKDRGKLVYTQSLGGLATGLSSYVNKRSGNLWIGWPGIASDNLNIKDKEDISKELSKYGYIPVFLSQNNIENFYDGYSNSVLWPLFHNLPVKKLGSVDIDNWWKSYNSVNRRFSEAVLNLADKNSQIWVHDYQLMLLPDLIRTEQKDANIGFFLHIPFPSHRQFFRIDTAEKLLKGMLGADLIGFHTTSYVNNFMSNIRLSKLGKINEGKIDINGRTIRVSEFPMGIDFEKFTEAKKLKDVKTAVKSYNKKYKKLKIIASVDRLDPSKGLVERLKAYRIFLERNPRMHKKIVFVMVAAPSRTNIEEYKNLSNRLSKLSTEINEEFGDSNWQPVDYINTPMPFENVTALFQIAHIAFIAPLKDGMNLTAKEFVASSRRGGVLILSESAGAAEELSDALIVDPKKPETLVNALEKALKMRRRELTFRINRMRKHLSTHTVQNWTKTFVDTMTQPIPKTPNITYTLNKYLKTKLLKDYKLAKSRLLLLDYDGSLVSFVKDYTNADPPKSLLKLLESLAAQKANEVVLISGRKATDLEKWFGKLPVNLVAEHGAAIRKKRQKWQYLENEDNDWKQILIPSIEKYVALTPGAKLEIKPHSLVWHYRAASVYNAQKYTVIIKRTLKPILKKLNLEMLQGNKVLEIKNPEVSKGSAAKRWLEKPYDFILSIGDDVTDETLFAVLPENARSIKVGRGRTKAIYRLSSPKEVINLLKKMA